MRTLLGNILSVTSPRTPGRGIFEILLANRGLDGAAAEKFFHPSAADLHDPFGLPDMARAADRVLAAREKGERVILYGDYDVDGTSSVALLFRFMSVNGWKVSYRLPHRVLDGYGFKPKALGGLAELGVKLVITLDCGTKDMPTISAAKKLGIDVVVIDHHAVPEIIPEDAAALVNPHRGDSTYPFSGLAASGMAFKLCHALCVRLFGPEAGLARALEFVDIALLGTVADCMPLVDENRAITALGLARISRSHSPALRRLFEEKADRPLDADLVGFHIGPLINAAGRMDTPMKALKMLLSEESGVDGILDELRGYNDLRRAETADAVTKATADCDASAPVMVWKSADARHGIVGLVAGRLAEWSGKPAVVLHDAGDKLVASMRSPHWFSTVAFLDRLADLFVYYGGHKQAGGFTILPEKWDEFLVRSRDVAAQMSLGADTARHLTVDMELDWREVTSKLVDQVQTMAPFGIGNAKPLFLLRGVPGQILPLGKDGKHLKIDVSGSKLRANAFGFGHHAQALSGRTSFDLVAELGINAWRGSRTAELTVKDFVVT